MADARKSGFADDAEPENRLQEFDEMVRSGVICISDGSSDVEYIADVEHTPGNGAAADPQALPHPEGVVRLTHMVGERMDRATSYTLRDVMQPEILRKAVLTTFVLDLDWLLAQLRADTKVVLVESYKPAEQPPGVVQTEGGRITLVHPRFGKQQQFPIMHSKLMLLFYDSYVRFVASSANLLEVDWTVLQNIVFIQDVPLDAARTFPHTRFGDDLACALRDLSVPEPVVAQVAHMDLSRVAIEIVTSVPTTSGRGFAHANAHGMVRLGQVADRLHRGCLADVFDRDNTALYCYGSSMGRIDNGYLRSFYSHIVGSTDHAWPATETRVMVGFHTDAQGTDNRFGLVSRHSIRCDPEMYRADGFPTHALRKIEPAVARTLVHAKVILARMGPAQSRGWMYLGSHNFTPGAWGRARFPASRGGGYINNYEFGIVIPDVRFETMFGRDSVTWNGARVPLPFRLAWSRYDESDVPCFTCQIHEKEQEQAADVSDRLRSELVIEAGEPPQAKRPRLDESAKHSDGGSGNDGPVDADADSGLPAGFFDEGVQPAEADGGGDASTDSDEPEAGGAAASGALAAGRDGGPSAADGIENPSHAAPPPGRAIDIESSLAAFESEIAALTGAEGVVAAEGAVTAEAAVAEATAEADGSDGDASGSRWESRMQRLVRLREIIRDGRQSMDPDESAEMAVDGSGSSGSDSDGDYSGLCDWRSGQL
ncbi:hypothetical protein H4R18_005845 [Coemansia javaensis]|uniref:Phospholipase D/nuclease n=1 Tax=Coemansia javaensis TaxID=2761396 RepID=A0A9W8LCP6_9FUNG|nr:hypothetical protein H4R18_005845 [Coemansia javaensis]